MCEAGHLNLTNDFHDFHKDWRVYGGSQLGLKMRVGAGLLVRRVWSTMLPENWVGSGSMCGCDQGRENGFHLEERTERRKVMVGWDLGRGVVPELCWKPPGSPGCVSQDAGWRPEHGGEGITG